MGNFQRAVESPRLSVNIIDSIDKARIAFKTLVSFLADRIVTSAIVDLFFSDNSTIPHV